jgi:aspartate aminotransferase-like enzyme
MKRRGYVIYAGQGDIRRYAFRVANMGTLTPADMEAVVRAFDEALGELRPPEGRDGRPQAEGRPIDAGRARPGDTR